MENLIKDLRFAFRNLVKHPAFTLIAVITLALGVGANSAIFSLVNATLIQPLPVADPDRLVYVFSGNANSVFSYPDYAEMRDRNQVFDGFIAWGGIAASLNSNDQTDLAVGAIVTGNFFEVLGARATLGRTISRQDDVTPGAHPVAMISHGLWQRRFGADPNIVGKQMLLNGHSFTIIGVTTPDFVGPQRGSTRDIYVPMMMQAIMRPPRAGYSGEMNPDLLNMRRNRWLYAVGRLKPGVTLPQAQSSLAAIAKQQEEANPESNRNRGVLVSPFNASDNPAVLGQLNSVAKLLMAVVGVVLLIACANIANLLLARGSARTKEVAVRLAIGATRARIVRQLLTESVLLSLLGGSVGLLIAWWAGSSLKAIPPPAGALPINPLFEIDSRVLLFTFGLSLVSGIVFGLAPALRASRPQLVPALKDEVWSAGKTSFFNLRSMLVVIQVALSVVLLIAAGLFLRSLYHARAINPGFDSDKIVTVPLSINLLRYTKPQGREFYRQAVERVEAIPGVESASLARVVALSGGSSIRSLAIEGREQSSQSDFRSENRGTAPSSSQEVAANVVGSKYFQTMGVPLLRGRDFNAQDTEERPKVVVVNESFVNKHFPGEEILGRRISMNGPNGPWQEIVGVVRDSKYITLGEAPTPVVYVALQQNHETGMTLHVRASGNPSNIVAAVRNEVQSIEKNLPVSNPTSMNESIRNSLYAARMGAVLIGVFGGLALVLAVIGLYGVMAFAVSRRTRELGIRMALGAQTRDIFKLVLQQGLALVLIGLALGLVAAAMVTRLLASFLYGISTTDRVTFMIIPVILAFVALLACYVPARRATKVDPLVALRYE